MLNWPKKENKMKYIILILVVILGGCASTGGSDNWSSIMSASSGRSAVIYVPNIMMYNNYTHPPINNVNNPHVHNVNRDAYIVPCMIGMC